MHGNTLITSLKLTNFLSFGSGAAEIDLRPLNILIGPNGSGKSNFIEALSVLRSTPGDLTTPIREGGGASEWLWKGSSRQHTTPVASIDAAILNPSNSMPLRYRLAFTAVSERLEIMDEAIENAEKSYGTATDVYFYYRYQMGNPVLNLNAATDEAADVGKVTNRQQRRLHREEISPGQSVLSQRKDPVVFPELTYLGRQFAGIRIFADWSFGRYTAARGVQRADLPNDFLLDDASNLGLVLSDLQNHAQAGRSVEEGFRKLYGTLDRINIRVSANSVQVFVIEKNLSLPIPATRLSDGALRYLCLLAILCHPNPPPLICIEEPELGLHPDIIPSLADLLVEASERTQIIVTTHSETLVDAFTDRPDDVLVCDRDDQGTRMRRLDEHQLRDWLKRYTLGELWSMGEIGGNRW